MSSLIESFPCCSNNKIAAAVNCFETEPASVFVVLVNGDICSRSAIPFAVEYIKVPFLLIANSAPGPSFLYLFMILSIIFAVSGQLWAEMDMDAKKNAITRYFFIIVEDMKNPGVQKSHCQ